MPQLDSERAGLTMRTVQVLIFGNRRAGTPLLSAMRRRNPTYVVSKSPDVVSSKIRGS